MRLTDDQAASALRRVHGALIADHPKADKDALLSDAGMGVAVAQAEWEGEFTMALFVQVAYRRAIDSYREEHPQIVRLRMNPDPKERDRMPDSQPMDPHVMADLPVAATEADELEELLSLCRNPIDAECLRRQCAGESCRAQARRVGVKFQRINFRCQRGTDDILKALGLPPKYRVREKQEEYGRTVPVMESVAT